MIIVALPRFARLPADRRLRLIAAAATEFAEKGFNGAGLGAIAEKAGIGKASFYYYFTDKADLCATVLQEAWRRLGAEGRIDLASLTAESYWPSVEALAHSNLDMCRAEPWLRAASILLNRGTSGTSGESVVDEYRAKRHAWEAAFIERGQELGAVRRDLPAGLLVSLSLGARQAANLWMLERIDGSDAAQAARLAEQVLGIYRSLLSPSQAAPARSLATVTRHPAAVTKPASRKSRRPVARRRA